MSNTSRWLKRAVAASAVLALGVTLSACSGAGGSTANSNRPENVIHVAVYGDAGNTVEQAMVDKFNATSKVQVILDRIPGANYQQKLQTIISTDAAPDVFFNWGGGSIQPFVKANLLLPLTDMIKTDPALQSSFLPSVFNAAAIDEVPYGIPMRGTQPVILFNNKQVLTDAGITAPKTWDDLLADVKVLTAKGVTPIALGGADQWPTLMWFEYLFDRVAGPDLLTKAIGGDTTVWDSADGKAALTKLKSLIDAGAFGTNFDSVSFVDGGSPALLRTGKAAFELMGSWEYSTQQTADKAWTEANLGYTGFPSIADGKGDGADLVGNTNNYYSVIKATRYPDTARDFLKLMYSDEFVQAQLAIGNLPTTTTTEKFLDQAADPAYATFQFNLVKDAPAFQLSWDQAYPQSASADLKTAVSQFFTGKLDVAGFISAMQAL
ncbi:MULTISPECIES: ABC transporter substrate-binding protein [unclassified Cryobacterium]|uniref:ABC transporter substrate-binding protein n=1 Tax=unclassified Cryobacterium TaxID=2649013 RepID=UPI002B22CDFC|nr:MULTISPECIES: extracellular solute-binding protein [unclassified Cryobacterium]MEB0000995.1 extracellular solute-binding protein [Cryobacterium sp. RTS3]MEB0267849.1 extracellular solute-binding protein [Cryobacterium sp. 10I5]